METLWRDFKQLRSGDAPPDRAELAKDVAAFANRIGGVIIYGAKEKGGFLDSYRELEPGEVTALRTASSEAVSNFCSPPPMFDPHPIPVRAGFVVAINVWPFAGQAVGVRRAKNGEEWSFPLRTGKDCRHLRPEQLPMLMIPQLRRVVALLYSIPQGAQIKHNSSSGNFLHRFIDVDEVENVVKLKQPVIGPGRQGRAGPPCPARLDHERLVRRGWRLADRGPEHRARITGRQRGPVTSRLGGRCSLPATCASRSGNRSIMFAWVGQRPASARSACAWTWYGEPLECGNSTPTRLQGTPTRSWGVARIFARGVSWRDCQDGAPWTLTPPTDEDGLE